MSEIKIYLSYGGGSANNNYLDIYDAAKSLNGLSRALAMTTHAFLNDGEIRTRAERATGAKIQLYAPNKGSFQEVVNVVFDHDVAVAFGTGIITTAFWDFFKWT